jgi:cobaltochelatase CobS
MNAFTNIKLSALARTELRRDIAACSQWDSYRREHNVSTADLTSSLCLELAARWNVDVQAAIARADNRANEAASGVVRTDKEESAPKASEIAASVPADKAAALAALSALLSPSVDMAQVEKLVEAKVKAALEGTALSRIELTRADNSTWKSSGTNHPLFEKLLRVLASRMVNGIAPNVWIAGPTGSGKTHAAEQAAHAMGVNFYFNGALSMTHELTGFVDAAGNYHTTPFREAYENGGVYLFDEVDASDNACLLALNAALANGVAAFPDKPLPVKRHKDFVCIGAANTFGQGATAEFIGRAKIDAAFLSRFPVKFAWGYDVALEQAISGNVDWAKRVQAARARAQASGTKIVIDPRHSQAGAALIAAGMSFDETAELTYLAGLSADQKRIVEGR